MGVKTLVGQLGITISVAIGLVAFFALLLVLSTVLAPFGLSEQTIGWIAAGTFFVGFWGLGLKFLFG